MDLYFKPSPNITIHSVARGPSGSPEKPLLVLLHYWGGSSATWHKLTSRDSPTSLSAIYQTLAIDLRGWGQSQGTIGEDGYSIADMATDVASLLEHLQSQQDTSRWFAHGFVLVGHSMGAKVALGTLTRLPVHLLGQLKGLVLVAPAPPIRLDLPAEVKEQQRVAYSSEDSVRWTVENVLASDKISETDAGIIIRDSLSGNQLAKGAWPTYGMREDISESVKESLSPIVKSFPFPAHVIVGELDIVEPKERVVIQVSDFLEQCGLQVTLHEAPGVKHLIPLESPEIIYRVVLSI
uniref:ARAD1A01540p n=1 Tax=Blastobotrys adeninivorans TaxID=409370 RepID=A0A060SW11_BLAAD